MIMVEDLADLCQRVIDKYGNIPIVGVDIEPITEEEAAKRGFTNKINIKFDIDTIPDMRCRLIVETVIESVSIWDGKDWDRGGKADGD